MKKPKMVIITHSDWNLDSNFKPLYFFDEHNEPCVIYYMSFPYSEFHGASPGDGWLDVKVGEKYYTSDSACLTTYEDFISEFKPDFKNQNHIKEVFEKYVEIDSEIEPIKKYLWNELKGIGTKKFLKEHLIEALEKIFNNTINKLSEIKEGIPYYDEKRFYHQKYEGNIKNLSPSFKICKKNGKRNVIMNDDAKTVLTLIHTNYDIVNDYVFSEW